MPLRRPTMDDPRYEVSYTGCPLLSIGWVGYGLGTRVSRFRVQGFRVQGSGFRVQGSGFRVQGSGFSVQRSGFRVQGSGFRFQGSGFRVQGSGFKVQGSGFKVQGMRINAINHQLVRQRLQHHQLPPPINVGLRRGYVRNSWFESSSSPASEPVKAAQVYISSTTAPPSTSSGRWTFSARETF